MKFKSPAHRKAVMSRIQESYRHDGRKKLIPVEQLKHYDSRDTPDKYDAMGGHTETNFKDKFGQQLSYHDLRNLHQAHANFKHEKAKALNKNLGVKPEIVESNAKTWFAHLPEKEKFNAHKSSKSLVELYKEAGDKDANKKWNTQSVKFEVFDPEPNNIGGGNYHKGTALLHNVSDKDVFNILESRYGKNIARVDGGFASDEKAGDESLNANLPYHGGLISSKNRPVGEFSL